MYESMSHNGIDKLESLLEIIYNNSFRIQNCCVKEYITTVYEHINLRTILRNNIYNGF